MNDELRKDVKQYIQNTHRVILFSVKNKHPNAIKEETSKYIKSLIKVCDELKSDNMINDFLNYYACDKVSTCIQYEADGEFFIYSSELIDGKMELVKENDKTLSEFYQMCTTNS